VLLLGHRGASRHQPENTLAAFALALSHGCDGFEFDVRRTSDGEAVVCHDSRLQGLPVGKNLYARLLQACPQLATLGQVLSHFGASAYLYIELKETGLEEILLPLLAQYPPQRGYVLASFLPEVIESLHARNQGLVLGLICDRTSQLVNWRNLPVSVVMVHRRLLSVSLVEELHGAGKQVLVWTINEARAMRAAARLGVDGMLSDDTALLSHTFRRS
jgi:glycerophosphoryl diester phosphodiesterase